MALDGIADRLSKLEAENKQLQAQLADTAALHLELAELRHDRDVIEFKVTNLVRKETRSEG
eukprot:CAMPEP_0119496156 /NCGR_PEP_ID=MMETSP1344-20130328/19574_1 /TAXON_ID=236787 /ORGANISM="Florenciella parvula, Strain CCMP2471" /LENGTH=60 /DNA_ID=CAMNT_0007531809 /DNA_START=46 /DNA_END=225 /DNA_ORIENTATION=+